MSLVSLIDFFKTVSCHKENMKKRNQELEITSLLNRVKDFNDNWIKVQNKRCKPKEIFSDFIVMSVYIYNAWGIYDCLDYHKDLANIVKSIKSSFLRSSDKKIIHLQKVMYVLLKDLIRSLNYCSVCLNKDVREIKIED